MDGLRPSVYTPIPAHLQTVQDNAPQNQPATRVWTPPQPNKAVEYAKIGGFSIVFLLWAFVSFLPFVFMVWLAMLVIKSCS